MTRPKLLDLFCGAGGAAVGSSMELAWAAGFFDGEGSTSVRQDARPGRRPSIEIGIEQTDERPMKRFAAAVGWSGNIVVRPARTSSRKPLYRIAAYGGAAISILMALWPYLSEPKREQATRVLRRVYGEDAA